MQEGKDIQLRVPESVGAGSYANNTLITHTREEFLLDFLMLAPPTGTVVSRVILSPGHMRRLLNTMQENLQKYEAKFGPIIGEEAPPLKMGFSG